MTAFCLDAEVAVPHLEGAVAAPAIRLSVLNVLQEQQSLTAVERFAQRHAANDVPDARIYEDLIPLSKPAPGQQYAFRVDLDACSGCKACVAACHNLNGLDEDEAWRIGRAAARRIERSCRCCST